jgi:two-component system, LytTR family, response regulator
MIKCLIVDDEPLAQEVIENYIAQIPNLEVVKKCSDAIQAFEAMKKEKIDLIFLDIQMPVIDGLGFLKSVKNIPSVIITTAFPQHALESYDFDVTDYLLKPISFERFLKAVNKVLDKKNTVSGTPEQKADFLFLKVDNKLVKVNFSEIMYVEGMKDYLKVFLKDRFYVVHQTMKGFEESLPYRQFVRVHKSYIVSLRAVKTIIGNYIEVNDQHIPIGANYKDELIQLVFKLNE